MNNSSLDGNSLSLEVISSIINEHMPVMISKDGYAKIEKARAIVEDILYSDKVIYGINTGFGSLSDVKIKHENVKELQYNLLRSHATGTGEPLPKRVAKTMMLLLANAFAKGHSGCRSVIADTLVSMINKNVIPVVPSQGSLGASGDLIPLAHSALVLIGEGEAWYEGKKMPGAAAMAAAGISLVSLEAKEGLSLINGTYAMGGYGSIVVPWAENLTRIADIAAAMTLEVTNGTSTPMKPEVYGARNYPGHKATADNIVRLTKNSQILRSHAGCEKIQDAYSIRCVPQVHGAVRDGLKYARNTFSIEINSSTDNPLIFGEDVVSAGNFHGQPLAFALDTLGMVMTSLGAISERRTDRLMNPYLSGMPAFLSPKAGLNSGFMISQYLSAALVLENQGLAQPGSVSSIPVSANKEDFISNGMWSARKAWTIVENTEKILAIELLCGAQGIEFHHGQQPGDGTKACYEAIRTVVEPLDRDRFLQEDVLAVVELIRSGKLYKNVKQAVGELI